jgi:hypothetical protein
MNWIKLPAWYLLFSTVIFFSADFFITQLIFGENNEKKYRIRHKYFDHTLLSNFDGNGTWGHLTYRVCTNYLGLRDDCSKIKILEKRFDIAFIGDSFTEAMGMSYEDSFVGMFSANYPNLKVANLGVASYAPSVYLKKIEWFLDKGIVFDHLIVFIDISDIQDEAIFYFEKDNGSIGMYDHRKETSTLKKVKTFVQNNLKLFYNGYFAIKNLVTDKKTDFSNFIFTTERSAWTYNLESLGYGQLGVRGGIEKAIKYMERLYNLLHEHNIKLSVGVYPWPAQLKKLDETTTSNLQSEIWRDFCVGKCEMYIDTFPIFKNLVSVRGLENVYHDFYIPGDVHFNKNGNQFIFSALRDSFDSSLKNLIAD